MALDVIDLRGFYNTPLGEVTQRVLSEAIRRRWDRTQGLAMLGIGYATPYLDPFRGEAERVLALMPDGQGVVNWPASGPSAIVLAATTLMPIADASIDRILVIHALETEENPRELLSEIWRILTPGGRIIAVVPNRRGLWARMDTTPFGHGQPFSRGQMTSLLRDTLFSPTDWSEALTFPPLQKPWLLKSASAWEKAGTFLGLPFSGVHMIEATKLLYRPLLVRPMKRNRAAMSPVFVPAASPRLDEIPL